MVVRLIIKKGQSKSNKVTCNGSRKFGTVPVSRYRRKFDWCKLVTVLLEGCAWVCSCGTSDIYAASVETPFAAIWVYIFGKYSSMFFTKFLYIRMQNRRYIIVTLYAYVISCKHPWVHYLKKTSNAFDPYFNKPLFCWLPIRWKLRILNREHSCECQLYFKGSEGTNSIKLAMQGITIVPMK